MCVFQRCHTVLPGGIATQAPSACCYLSVVSSSRRMTCEKAASSKQQWQKAGNLHRDGSAMWQLFLAGCDYDVPRFLTTRITGPELGCSVRCWAPTFCVKVSAWQKGSSSWYINDRWDGRGLFFCSFSIISTFHMSRLSPSVCDTAAKFMSTGNFCFGCFVAESWAASLFFCVQIIQNDCPSGTWQAKIPIFASLLLSALPSTNMEG